jgi:hypothetical protein
MGHLKCKGNFNLRENVDMNPIGEDSTQSTTAIYYPGDPRATVGCCSFFVSNDIFFILYRTTSFLFTIKDRNAI